MKANNTPANVANLLTAAAYVRNETIINGNQAAQLDAMIGQIKDLTTKIEAVPAKIADLAAQGKEKAVAMWERMAARYKAQFADAVANLRAWLVDFKANRPNVQINLDEPEEPETPNPDNTPAMLHTFTTLTDGAKAIALQSGKFSNLYIRGERKGMTAEEAAKELTERAAAGVTRKLRKIDHICAVAFLAEYISRQRKADEPTTEPTGTTPANAATTTPAAKCLTMYLDNTREIYDRYTVPAIDKVAAMMRSNATHRQQFDATPAGVTRLHEVKRALSVAAGLVRKCDHIAPTRTDIDQAVHDYAAYIVECAQYENANA